MLWQTWQKEVMYSMISRLFRPVKEGFRGVIRHGAMSLSSATAVTLTLIIISLFLIFTVNVRQFTEGLEQTITINARVDFDHESAEKKTALRLRSRKSTASEISHIILRTRNSNIIWTALKTNAPARPWSRSVTTTRCMTHSMWK